MGTVKLAPPPAAETRYWKSLTDEQLLEISFRTDDPAMLAGVVHELPATDETPFVEFAYNTKTGSGHKVRCIHCRYDNHNRGFVLRFKNAARILVGKDCGKKLYGADFDVIEKDFDAAKDRAYYLRCKRSTLAAAPSFRAALSSLGRHPALAQFQDAKHSFNRAMPGLALDLAKAVLQDGGDLYLDEKVRDLDAEARREEQQDILAQHIGTMTKTAIRKAREDGLLRHEGKRPRPIFKRVPKRIGSIRGLAFFRVDQEPPRDRIGQLSARAIHILEALPASTMTTAQLRVVFRDLGQIVDALIDEIDRLAELPDAFDAGNLSRIATWATARSEDHTVYISAIGQLTVDGPRHDRPRTARFPTDYRPPSRQPFVTFRAALTA
jgi:hypothetical protein